MKKKKKNKAGQKGTRMTKWLATVCYLGQGELFFQKLTFDNYVQINITTVCH